MKYIIDIPNDDVNGWIGVTPLGKKLYIPISVEDGEEYSIATEIYAEEYTEPDINTLVDKAIKTIENEVWELLRVIEDMDYDDYEHCFGENYKDGKFYKLSYQEAKARYDAWKKSKDEIRVGDEVEAEPGNKACVLYENPDGTLVFVFKADGTAAWWSKCAIHKTGKNHSEVAELLKKMKRDL